MANAVEPGSGVRDVSGWIKDGALSASHPPPGPEPVLGLAKASGSRLPCGGDGPRHKGEGDRSPSIALQSALLALPAYAGDLPQNFVRLVDIDPTIRQDMRYAGSDEFPRPAGKRLRGPRLHPDRARQRRRSLKVQQRVAGDGLTLVVFDCYRPVRAVDDFVDWTRQGGPPDPRWYPKVKRGDLIAEGYIGERSSHSRGSTVDVALGHSTSPPPPACPTPIAGAKDRHAGIRHRLRLLRLRAATQRTRRCRRAPSPIARNWSPRCERRASETTRTNGGISR